MEIQLQDRTLGQWMEHWAETTPDKEYLVYSDRDLRFTWKEFNERVDRMGERHAFDRDQTWHACRYLGD